MRVEFGDRKDMSRPRTHVLYSFLYPVVRKKWARRNGGMYVNGGLPNEQRVPRNVLVVQSEFERASWNQALYVTCDRRKVRRPETTGERRAYIVGERIMILRRRRSSHSLSPSTNQVINYQECMLDVPGAGAEWSTADSVVTIIVPTHTL